MKIHSLNSLSVILPVHNAEQFIQENTIRLLEILPELVDEFQIIVVDDGSTDATGDLAQELARRYAQVTAIFHGCQRGETVAVESAKRMVTCEMVFVQEAGEIDENRIRNFVRQGEIPRRRIEPARLNAEDQLVERLMKWGMALKEYRNRTGQESMVRMDESTDVLSGKSGPEFDASEMATSGDPRQNVQMDAIPAPKYASIAEKRLEEMSRIDRGE